MASSEKMTLMGGGGGGDKAVDDHATVAKKVSVLSIALLCFSCVAGGPFGIETAVQAAGAMPTIIGLFVAGALWGCPQALITAELSAAIPANGGPVIWTRRAFGDHTSFVVSLLLIFNQLTDICLYPTLVAAYFPQLFPDQMTCWWQYGIKLIAMVITVVLNIVGIDALSASAALLTVVILAPFAILPIVAASKGMVFDWKAIGPAGIPSDAGSSVALFCSTILWNMQVGPADEPPRV